MADINWDDMRIFLAVARENGLTGAAKVLRLDPATVGRRVARLELALSARLFVKSPQGYVATGAGQRLMERAQRAEAEMAGAMERVREEPGLSGVIRIGAPDGCATFLLPQVTAAICDAHPGLEVQIVALPRVFNLSKREADMAIAVSKPVAGRLTAQKVTDYRLHLAASHDYLAAQGIPREIADLKGRRMIGYIPDMIFDRELDYLAEAGAERVALGSNSVAVQMAWVRAGAGLGILHDFALPAMPGLRRVLRDRLSLTRSFWLIRHVDDRRVERLNLFADELAHRLRDEVLRLEAAAP